MLKKYWVNQAKAWAEPLRELSASKKDIALNNLFVFRSWFEMTASRERERHLETLLQDARYHHPKAIVPSAACGTGLIWGDYFFLDALLDYRRLAKVAP